jgi:hypothetical protein
MTTGQAILSIFALVLLSTVLQGFYGSVFDIGDDIMSGQDGIMATTIATSYMEIANGLSFDEVTDSSNIAIANLSALTPPLALGHEAGEDSLVAFNDFDDFNNYSEEKVTGDSLRHYRTSFHVYYVDPDNIEHVSLVPTYVKRLDLKTWRTYPIAGAGKVDTLRMSTVLGYFHFN